MFSITSKGNFNHLEKYLKKSLGNDYMSILEKYGQRGVQELAAATPIRSGETASSWDYRITKKDGNLSIEWINTNINDHVNIAMILQYGHGTRNGGYVSGIDYINPALKPIFDELAESAWKEVTKT